MKARILAKGHQVGWGRAFADGLQKHGWSVDIATTWAPCDLLVVWGVRRQDDIGRQRAAGGEICVLERGYIGDRFHWTSVSFGGELNGRAEFRGGPDTGRFDRLHRTLLREWSSRDGYALLVGQVPGDMSLARLRGRIDGWVLATAAALKAADWRVLYRPHPLAAGKGLGSLPGCDTHRGPLAHALLGAGLVVTFNSNTAVDAVVAGVPTVTADEGSMAWPVTTHDIAEAPIRPERGEWLDRLASSQWSRSEMSSGACWEHLHRSMFV